MRSSSLEIQARRTIQKYNMLSPGEHVVVAASGGADSTALLLFLHKLASRLELTLTVAHLNHRIREAEAEVDHDFVRNLSFDLGLPFISESLEIKVWATEAKRNLEDFARQQRYGFLHRVARRVNAHKIAVGHTLNDQAETVLFRFIRGSGFKGLSAIHPVVEGQIIRPLLECSRAQVLNYLKENQIDYREDFTNADLRYSRNRIRLELIPYLERNFNPRLIRTLAIESDLAREIWSFIESHSRYYFDRLHRDTENGISLKIKDLMDLHPAVRKQILRQALKELTGTLHGITFAHIEKISTILGSDQSGRKISLPNRSVAIRQFENLLLLRPEPEIRQPFSYSLSLPGTCRVPEAEMIFTATICSAPTLKTIKDMCQKRAYLEQALLPPVLTIRSRLPGDRYGGPGHRKVKKMLIDKKISLTQRSTLPLIVAGEDVIWIPGFRPARAYEVRPGSGSCVMIEINEERR